MKGETKERLKDAIEKHDKGIYLNLDFLIELIEITKEAESNFRKDGLE